MSLNNCKMRALICRGILTSDYVIHSSGSTCKNGISWNPLKTQYSILISWGDSRGKDCLRSQSGCFFSVVSPKLTHSEHIFLTAWRYTWEALEEWPPWGQCGRESQLYVAAGAQRVSVSAHWRWRGGRVKSRAAVCSLLSMRSWSISWTQVFLELA